MKGPITAPLFAAFASVCLVAATVDLSSIPRKTTGPTATVPGAYIVELDPTSVGSAGRFGKRSPNIHADFYEDLVARGVDMVIRAQYDNTLFVGASLSLNNADDLIHLANANGVIAITPVTLIPRPVPQESVVLNSDGDQALATGGGDAQSVHAMTGVNKLHERGITGKGIRIGIIDTGINYPHPSLGGCFGPGCKVAYGFDFVGDAYNGANDPSPDSDPNDTCNGHGTHVAGIVGANPGNKFNMTGVAFEATIGGYRVFGCEGGVSDDILIKAIIRAFTDGNDVITMSLGGTVGWTETVSSVVSSRVAKAGRIVTIAAGNSGESGAFFASGPASGIDVIAVASVDNTVIHVQNAKSSDRDAPIPYFSLQPLNFAESLPVFAISKTLVPDDACNPLPDSTPDLSGFMVLIRRGGCAFESKLENVAKKGARVALVYNNAGSPNAFSGDVIPGALISSEDGAYLLEKFNAGQPPQVSFPQQGGADTIAAPTGGLVSTFSSYGPTFDAFLKPALAAPGGGIVSTFPLPMGAFAVLSGTSMATPYMAGVSALLLAVRGRNANVARAARDILQSTANIVPFSKDESALFQTASQQGAGLVDAFKALTSTTIVAPGQLLLNDTAFFNGKQTFTVANMGSKAVTYKLSHTPAGTAHTLINDSIQPALYPVPLTADFARLSLSSDTFNLKPGEKKVVTVSFTAPTFTDRTIPVYSGWIEVAGQETGESLSVTYLGIAARLKESKVIDNTDFQFGHPIPALIDSKGNIATEETSFNFKNGDFPSILYRLVFGTPTLLFDLVAADFDQSALVQRDLQTRGWLDDFIGSINGNGETELKSWWADLFSTWTGAKPAGTFGLVPTIGPLAQFDYIPRHSQSATPGQGFSVFSLSNPVFANNTRIPNGRYRILMRALKVTGDPTDQNDYESFLSPVIGINA